MQKSYSLQELATKVGGTPRGNADVSLIVLLLFQKQMQISLRSFLMQNFALY